MALRPPVPSTFAKNYLYKMAVGQMTSIITIERPESPSFDASTGVISTAGSQLVWSGPARVYSESGSLSVIGDEMVSVGQTYVSIPQDATPIPRVDDLVIIDQTDDDPALNGCYFRVVDVTMGGIASPTRRLTVTRIESSPWSSS